jgi:hypothetical protein
VTFSVYGGKVQICDVAPGTDSRASVGSVVVAVDGRTYSNAASMVAAIADAGAEVSLVLERGRCVALFLKTEFSTRGCD